MEQKRLSPSVMAGCLGEEAAYAGQIVIIKRRMFYIIIFICKPTKNERLLAETLLVSSDSTNYGWHGNLRIAQKSAVKKALTRIPNYHLSN